MAGAEALKAGECGYAYILGALPTDKKRPVLVTPLISGSTRFDRKFLDQGKATVIFADETASILSVTKDGDVILNGKKLFDPTNPIWEGRPPVIAWPE